MKVTGLILIIVGVAMLLFILLHWFNQPAPNISPIHEDDGVKVIYETPTQK